MGELHSPLRRKAEKHAKCNSPIAGDDAPNQSGIPAG
jgi:hypothetical protein